MCYIVFANSFFAERYINNLKMEYERFLWGETSPSNWMLRHKHRGKDYYLFFFLKVVWTNCLVCHHGYLLLFALQKLWYSWSLVVRDSSFCEFLELAAPRLWTEFLLWHAADEGCFSRTRCAESWRLPLLCCALYDTNVKGKLAFKIFAHLTFL